MKTKILIVAFAVAVIASFSFITINKNSFAQQNTVEKQHHVEPMLGFALEDEHQF